MAVKNLDKVPFWNFLNLSMVLPMSLFSVATELMAS